MKRAIYIIHINKSHHCLVQNKADCKYFTTDPLLYHPKALPIWSNNEVLIELPWNLLLDLLDKSPLEIFTTSSIFVKPYHAKHDFWWDISCLIFHKSSVFFSSCVWIQLLQFYANADVKFCHFYTCMCGKRECTFVFKYS